MRFAFAILFFITAGALGSAQRSGPFIEQPGLAETESATLPHGFFTRVVNNSGQIFSGTVLQVKHHNSNSPHALGTTVIRFQVDKAIRGVRKGQVLDIKEWAGLWASGRERYRPGERVLLFLYPPSKLGLTSPIGPSGRFAIDHRGNVLINTRGREVRTIEMRRMVSAIRQREVE